MTHRLGFKLLGMLLVAAAFAPAARAQENTDAQRLYKEGWRLYQDKQYAEACPLLERSVAASATVVNRGALALCYESSGKVGSAYRAWQAVADQASSSTSSDAQRARRAALKKVEQLRAKVPMLVLRADGVPADTQISLDGKAVPPDELGVAVAVDPGPHVVAAHAAGHRDFSASVDAARAADGQPQEVKVGPLEKLPPPEIARPNPPTGPTIPAGAAPKDTERRGGSSLRWVGLGVAGAGVVALGVGTVFGLGAKSKWDDAKDAGCDDDGNCPNRAAADLVDDARSKATLSTVTVIAGVGLVAGGVALYFLAPRERAVTPSVAVGPGGATLGVQGAF